VFGPVTTFPELMQKMTALVASGKITTLVLDAIADDLGLPNRLSLANRPDLVASFSTMIDERIAQ
jgi:hypothetical protein